MAKKPFKYIARRGGVRPYFKIHTDETAPTPWKIGDLCAAYKWPKNLHGRGVIAIIELGGGWQQDDIESFCTTNKI